MDNHENGFHFTMRLRVGSKRRRTKLLIRLVIIKAVLFLLSHWFRND